MHTPEKKLSKKNTGKEGQINEKTARTLLREQPTLTVGSRPRRWGVLCLSHRPLALLLVPRRHGPLTTFYNFKRSFLCLDLYILLSIVRGFYNYFRKIWDVYLIHLYIIFIHLHFSLFIYLVIRCTYRQGVVSNSRLQLQL